MYIEDTLSRAALKENYMPHYESDLKCHVNEIYSSLAVSKPYLEQLVKATDSEENLQILTSYYLYGWPSSKGKVPNILKILWNFQSEIHVLNEIVFKGTKLIVPSSMRSEKRYTKVI